MTLLLELEISFNLIPVPYLLWRLDLSRVLETSNLVPISLLDSP